MLLTVLGRLNEACEKQTSKTCSSGSLRPLLKKRNGFPCFCLTICQIPHTFGQDPKTAFTSVLLLGWHVWCAIFVCGMTKQRNWQSLKVGLYMVMLGFNLRLSKKFEYIRLAMCGMKIILPDRYTTSLFFLLFILSIIYVQGIAFHERCFPN